MPRWVKIRKYNIEVTKLGLVRDLYSKLLFKPFNSNGYKQISIKLNGKWIKKNIHQLVARAFLGPCPKNKEVNHIDLDKSNPKLSNLEYLTSSENKQHAIRNGVKYGGSVTNRLGESNGMAILTEKDIIEIRLLHSQGFPQRAIMDLFGISQPLVSYIVNRKTWKHLK